jgi:hypothetical protein
MEVEVFLVVLWVMAPYEYKLFEGAHCHRTSTLKLEAVCFSETSIHIRLSSAIAQSPTAGYQSVILRCYVLTFFYVMTFH